jgi:hypothetical protein
MSERISHAPSRGGPSRIASLILAWFDRPEGRTLRLLLFGLVVALLGTFELARVHPAPWSLQGGRVNGLRWTLDALNHHAGGGDDQGLYLVVPWLAHTLGWQDPVNLLRWMALIALGATVALYPWLIRGLSGSTLAGLASPFVLLIGLWLLPLGDLYWVASWVILGLLPVVLLLDRHWPRRGLLILIGLLVLASLASSIRSQAGLPLLLAAVLVLVRRPWSGWSRAGAVALCLVAYLSVSTFGMATARAEREHQLHGRALAGATGHGHPFWHTAYIGLGYLPNDWDIRFYDGVAYRDVLRKDPKAIYLGPAYGRILRNRYFKLVGDDPVYAVRAYVGKLAVAVRPAWFALLVLALVGPWLLLVVANRARWRRDALMVALAGIIGLASPLLATPDGGLLLGWLAAVLLAGILAGAAVVATWGSPNGFARFVHSGAGVARAHRAVVGITVSAVVLVLACFAAGPSIHDSALRWLNSKPGPQVTQPPDATH